LPVNRTSYFAGLIRAFEMPCPRGSILFHVGKLSCSRPISVLAGKASTDLLCSSSISVPAAVELAPPELRFRI
jgi:hypothetical protein